MVQFKKWHVPVLGMMGLAAGVYAYKYYNIGVPVYSLPGAMGKHVVIVTGADGGIGKACVEAFAAKGARVLMACRDVEKCKKVRRDIVLNTKNRHVVCRECDLASFESVKKFVARVIEEEPRLDILINNAAVKYVKPKRTTRERIEMQMSVNHFGHYLLTMLLLEKLKESTPSRVVNVTCKAYTKGEINFDDLNFDTTFYKPAKAYDQSKLATVLMTKELAAKLEGTGVSVLSVDPGYTDTAIDRYTDGGSVMKWFKKGFYYVFRRTKEQGSFPVLYAAVSSDLDGVTGKYVNKKLNVEEFAENAQDPKQQRRLWLTNEKWVKLNQAYGDVKTYIEQLRQETLEKKNEMK